MQTTNIEKETFTKCAPKLQYKDGLLQEVIEVGSNGTTIARVYDPSIINIIKQGAAHDCIDIVSCVELDDIIGSDYAQAVKELVIAAISEHFQM